MSESKMREALEFYADENRYNGANQRNDKGDKWSGDSPYILDVTRDGGAIAREALAQPAEVVGLTDEEITKVWNKTPDDDEGDVDIFGYARAIIAAHEAKKAGKPK